MITQTRKKRSTIAEARAKRFTMQKKRGSYAKRHAKRNAWLVQRFGWKLPYELQSR